MKRRTFVITSVCMALFVILSLRAFGEEPVTAPLPTKIEDLQKQIDGQNTALQGISMTESFLQKWYAEIQTQKAVSRDAIRQLTEEIAKQKAGPKKK